MRRALQLAERALHMGEVPVGAVLVCEGQIIAEAHNEVEARCDPTAHAELLAIQRSLQARGQKFLSTCTLYVTLEPCPMCAGAILWARLGRVVFGAWDPKAGAAGSLFDLLGGGRLHHRPEVLSGLEAEAAEALLRRFFATLRAQSP
ncbi:MAG: tRNA adenosine(34) deaminase TadA [Bacteroidetes bacterium]|nr:tRNA adenosine(34) deaminase TadA [Rhodothermia bacterium]MCS7154258.1 tRNA adenosine(34) deaminase TadA [Bacteroidota bacterium]MCX7906706.1 tRNA adenosine(34) deaminase TadA [Bacteroidota bacterium]MDW8137014.1 tRNA adenosine(34) deaminase TadA [Bacteroidota bacterium]MDW8285115.1 tRNA adenosine(34) deaminase TadA [Bacteroidota bacterium]